MKERIIELNRLRYELIYKKNASWDKESEKYGYNTLLDEAKIDEYADEILKLIKENHKTLDFEFIFEQLANLGHCPNLLNDDNSRWCVCSTGYQNVVMGDEPEDVETSFFIEAKQWKNSPREALYFYLNNEEE